MDRPLHGYARAMRLAGAILLGILSSAQIGCGGEQCGSATVDLTFQATQYAPGLYVADVATDRCGGEGTEEWRYEVECVGDCPAFTARVFLEASLVAEEPSDAPYTEIVAHESYTQDINEYRLYVETDASVPANTYVLRGSFTGSEAMLLP